MKLNLFLLLVVLIPNHGSSQSAQSISCLCSDYMHYENSDFGRRTLINIHIIKKFPAIYPEKSFIVPEIDTSEACSEKFRAYMSDSCRKASALSRRDE